MCIPLVIERPWNWPLKRLSKTALFPVGRILWSVVADSKTVFINMSMYPPMVASQIIRNVRSWTWTPLLIASGPLVALRVGIMGIICGRLEAISTNYLEELACDEGGRMLPN